MPRLWISLGVLTVAVAAAAGAAGAAGTANGPVDRVTAEVTIRVFSHSRYDPNGPTGAYVGVARIHVRADDVDPTPPPTPGPTSDTGSISCEPVGSLQCSAFPNGGAATDIDSLVFDPYLPANDALVQVGYYFTLSLVDRGSPGNRSDQLQWSAGIFTHEWWDVEIVAGHVTVDRR